MSLLPTSPSPPSRKNLDFFTNAEFVVWVPLLIFIPHLELNLASRPSRKRPSALFHSIFITSNYSISNVCLNQHKSVSSKQGLPLPGLSLPVGHFSPRLFP